MKIHVLSDLHLETSQYALPPVDCDVIVAAGDIGVGLQGLEYLKTLQKPVVYVLGNHEYWTKDDQSGKRVANPLSMDDLISEIRRRAEGSNVHFLENDWVKIDGVRFVGATLWTNFGDGNEHLMNEANIRMNDYSCIPGFTPEIALAKHEESIRFLDACLAMPFDGPTVVVTHMHPSFESLKRIGVPDELLVNDSKQWRISRLGQERPPQLFRVAAYASDLSNLLGRHREVITYWCAGHIHENLRYVHAGVEVLCNPRGYKSRAAKGFDPHFVVDTNDAGRIFKQVLQEDVNNLALKLGKIRSDIGELETRTSSQDMVIAKVLAEAILLKASQFSETYVHGYTKSCKNLDFSFSEFDIPETLDPYLFRSDDIFAYSLRHDGPTGLQNTTRKWLAAADKALNDLRDIPNLARRKQVAAQDC